MMETTNAVEIKNLVKAYGTNKALKDISFCVNKGEIMGFLGPNGAGKSTTMNIICGCISANSGSVSVCGCDVLENPKAAKSKIGYLPENPPLYFDMTVWEYLNFVYELKKVRKNRNEHLESIMELVKITDMKNRIIKNLSKGYKQRVGLAQALIGDPEVLILDEPTVGLDPKQIVEIRNVIKEIGESRTIILSTHILQEVSAVCDRVTIISHGNIVAQNTLSGLEEDAGGKDMFRLLVKGGGEDALKLLEGIENVVNVVSEPENENGEKSFIITQAPKSDVRADIIKVLTENNISVLELSSATLSLEEIFIKLTSSDYSENEEPEVELEEIREDFEESETFTQEDDEDDSNI